MTVKQLLKFKCNKSGYPLWLVGDIPMYNLTLSYKGKDYYIIYYKSSNYKITFDGLDHITNNNYTYACGLNFNGGITLSYTHAPVS